MSFSSEKPIELAAFLATHSIDIEQSIVRDLIVVVISWSMCVKSGKVV